MKILDKFNIKPKNIKLYEQAFTHTSYANENNKESYERLEYLGDAVLELIMSEYLFNKGDIDEGMMTKMRSHYVCESALYEYSIELGINKNILLGKGELENGGKYRKAIVADVFEAFLAAIYLDHGFEKTKEFFSKYVLPIVENKNLDFIIDYKSKLQEFVQTDRRSLEYIVINETGPSHDKTFTIEVKIDNIVYGCGKAHSKKEAEQLAAKDALKKAQRK